jgi:hypothetical protein
VEVLRFTRVLFGLVSSPFLLGGVLEVHLDYWKSKAPEAVDTLKKSLYVDDIISGGNTVGEAKQRKSEATDIRVMQPFHFINGHPMRTNWTEKVTTTKIARNKQQQNNSSA